MISISRLYVLFSRDHYFVMFSLSETSEGSASAVSFPVQYCIGPPVAGCSIGAMKITWLLCFRTQGSLHLPYPRLPRLYVVHPAMVLYLVLILTPPPAAALTPGP